MNYEITPAENSDIPTILELWKNSGIRIEPEDSPESLSRFINNESSRCYKAVYQESVVGAILCGSDGRYGYIHHIAVDDNFREQGIGRALVGKCQDFFKEHGINTKAVFVWETNDTALNFWKSMNKIFDKIVEICDIYELFGHKKGDPRIMYSHGSPLVVPRGIEPLLQE